MSSSHLLIDLLWHDGVYVLDPESVKANLDENTIGIFVILGSTYTGTHENVEAISKVLDEYEKE
jgi:glutamate decarboxylase